MTGFLGTELDGPLSIQLEGAGEGSKDGSTRRKVTTWLEDSRAATLKKGLEEHLDQSARPVWVHPQLDKQLIISLARAGFSLCLDQEGSAIKSSQRQWPGTFACLLPAVQPGWGNLWE